MKTDHFGWYIWISKTCNKMKIKAESSILHSYMDFAALQIKKRKIDEFHRLEVDKLPELNE